MTSCWFISSLWKLT